MSGEILDIEGGGREMSDKLLFRRATRISLDSIENYEKVPVERMKRQRMLSSEHLNHFAPKHYPSIFLDQRLRSQLF